MTARDRSVLIVVVAVVVIVAGWLLVVAPKRDQAGKLGGSVEALQSQLATLQSQLAASQQARASFSASYAQLAQLGEAVPEDDNVPSLLVELESAANSSGVDFRGLQVTPAGSSTASSTPQTNSTAASAATANPPPPGVSIGSAGFGTEQFTLSFTGTYFDLVGFLGRLQRFVVANGSLVQVSGRLMTLGAISLGPSQQGFPEMTANVSATTYLLPSSQGLLDGATAAGPGPGAAGSPSSTGSSTTGSSTTGSSPGSTIAPTAAISGASIATGGTR